MRPLLPTSPPCTTWWVASTALALAAGCAPPPPDQGATEPPRQAAPPWFQEEAGVRGLDFHHDSGHRERYFFPETVCGGAALLDMDGDGDLDAYLVQSGRVTDQPADRPGNQLFRNRGDGTFEDVSAGSGADDHGYGMGAVTGDIDADGDLDLYVTNYGPNVLLRNDGDGRFTDVTDHAGVGEERWSSSGAFFDYDRDGDLDLFVANYVHWTPGSERDCFSPAGLPNYCHPNTYEAPVPDTLYRNDGDGTFTDVSKAAGIDQAFGNGLGVICEDFDGDGWTDVFVANDGMENQLWMNQGGGRFEDRAHLAGCAMDQHGQTKAGMGVAVADVDHDADPDLLVVNLHQETDSFYRNDRGLFTDATAAVGLGVVSQAYTRFGTAFVDFDHDGWLDLYEANGRVSYHPVSHTDDPYAEPNVLFRGIAGGRFEEASPRGGTTGPVVHSSRAAAFGDIDNDGAVDILVVNRDGPPSLLHNVAPRRGNWIMLRVIDRHGSDAIGAVVTLEAGGQRLRQRVRTAYSYCAANDPRLHFGLGPADHIDALSVSWPDGSAESFGGTEVNQIVTLRQGGAPISPEAG